jgi:hypothetical protein
MSYRFKTDGMGFAEFEEGKNLFFSKQKPNLPSKDSFQPEIEGGLCWQRAAEGSKRI